MSEERKVRCLEGLGYLAAFMVAVGSLLDHTALRFFNVLGLVFAIIVIVRLMAMNITLFQVSEVFRMQSDFDVDSDVVE